MHFLGVSEGKLVWSLSGNLLPPSTKDPFFGRFAFFLIIFARRMCTCIRRLHYKARIQLGLFATWPEFWAIGLSFLGLLDFVFFIIWPPRPLCPPTTTKRTTIQKENMTRGKQDNTTIRQQENKATAEQEKRTTRQQGNKTTRPQYYRRTIQQDDQTTGHKCV